MRNKNTLEKLEYVLSTVCWSALLFLLYRSILFRPVFSLDNPRSMAVLAGSVVLGIVTGILLTYRRRRNYVSIFCNIVLSFGPYYILSFRNTLGSIFILAGHIAAAVILLYSFAVLIGYLRSKRKPFPKASGRQWLGTCFLGSRTLVSFVLAFLLLGSWLQPVLGLRIGPTTPLSPDGESDTGNMGILLLLQEDAWDTLDTDARLNVMQAVADMEANSLGIETLTVRAMTLDKRILGQYNNASRTVTLNLHHLSTANAKTMLSTLCHECYHAYQHRLVDLYDRLDDKSKALLLFQDASRYKSEFSNYISGTEDYEAYSSQRCEIDSDKYADEASASYYYRISQYIKENTEGI